MPTSKELLEKRAKIITQARAKMDEITDSTPEARAAEIKVEFDAMIAEATGLEVRAQDLADLEAAEASLSAGDPNAPVGDDVDTRGDQPPAAVTYRSAFYDFLGAGGVVSDLPPEVRAALLAGPTPTAVEQRAQLTGTGAAGGFLIPEEGMAPLVVAMAAFGPMMDDTVGMSFRTTSGAVLPIPGVDDTGNEALPRAEGDKFTEDGSEDAVFTKKTLDDYMYGSGWIDFSLQLATSGMTNVEGLLGALIGERLGRKNNRALTVGSGVGEPQGIVTGATVGKVGTSANSITADEFQSFLKSMDPAYRSSPQYGAMFNDNTLGALHALKDGDGNYLIKEAPNLAGTLRVGAVTARYRINQAVADMGANARSMVAGDFARYYKRLIGGPVLGVMQDRSNFPNYSIAGYQRIDGVVADPRAIKAFVHPA